MKIILFIENFLLILVTISFSSAHASVPRKCVNEKCSEPISIGRASITYASPNDINLSFKVRDKITVYSKTATETNDDTWYVEINGKYGYAPKKFILEERLLVGTSRLITVENVPTATIPTAATTAAKTEPEIVQNTNESSSAGAEVTNNSNEETVSNVSEVQNEELQERPKRSIDVPIVAEKETVVVSENVVDAVKSDEVKIEDLNAYDSKNFDGNSESADEDEDGTSEGEDDNEEEEDEEGDDYDDAENAVTSEEETKKPVVEEPIVKKTAYVTTDTKTERSAGIGGGDDVEPQLEIMAPTQAEIDKLKQQQELKNSVPETPSSVASSSNPENASTSSTSTTNEAEPLKVEENQPTTTTTTIPIDLPQNPLEIPIETTTPLPSTTQTNVSVDDAAKVDPTEDLVPKINASDNSATTVDSVPKVDSISVDAIKTEPLPSNPTSSEPIVLNVDVPPFKPLPQSVDSIVADLNDSTADLPNNIVAPVEINVDPSSIEEPVVPVTPLNDNSAVNNVLPVEEIQIVREDTTTTTTPTVEIADNSEVSNESLRTEEVDPTTFDYSAIPSSQDSDVVVENLTATDFGNDSNNLNDTPSDGSVIAENEIVPPLDILNANDQLPPTADYVTQKVNEGVGVIEPILQSHNIEQQQLNSDSSDVNSERIENDDADNKEGMFSGIFNSIKNLFGGSSTVETIVEDQSNENFDKALNDILFSQAVSTSKENNDEVLSSEEYCENISPNSCPRKSNQPPKSDNLKHSLFEHGSHYGIMDQHPETDTLSSVNSYNDFVVIFMGKLVELVDVIVYVVITAIFVLAFTLGYYCITNNRKEGSLVSKLNIVERQLMTSSKECDLLKCDLVDTRNKLASIEDNSFGSNEMVIALKRELDQTETERAALHDQVILLEKELETAAEAGLELNKMVSELLNNQSGSDSIISSVEELQRQLNEQQATTESINALLAEKSRENSELQILLSEKSIQFESELESLQNLTDRLQAENSDLKQQVEDGEKELEQRFNREMKTKTAELTKISKELSELRKKHDDVCQSNHMHEARVQVLDNLLKQLKKEEGVDLDDAMSTADMKTKMLALTKERESLIDRLEGEIDARKLLEDHVKVVSEEVSSLRQEYSVAEKDKLEAQTRLEVLSTYFKDKEMQLQKELSLKEAMTMKQQGETSSTVERIRSLQAEIQELKSQNDSLKAEIEAQIAAHKAQIAAAENRAHESWLSARQAERRIEEARSEATALRRKLTTIVGNANGVDNNLQNRVNSLEGLSGDLTAQSPIHVEQSGSSLLMNLPHPPFLPPPPFMPPPFMPPPFMPASAEMRPPPLGRLMSPPPPNNRYSPNILDDRDRYDHHHHRGRYSPNDRYNDYSDIMSQYETETDFSPPGSPEPRTGYRDRNYKQYSPSPPPLKRSDSRSNKSNSNKGGQSSGSVESMGSRKSQGRKKV